VQAIFAGVAASVPFSIAGIFFSRDILRLMGGDPWVIEHGHGFTSVLLGTNVVIVLIFIINAIFRGAGDAAIAMRVLWLSNAINLGLDPLLIFGWGPFPALGVEGAAVATSIGRGVGVATQLVVLFRGARHIRVAWSQVRLHGEVMARLIRTSLGGVGQFIIATSSWIGLVRIASVFGSDVVAGYTIAVRIFVFTLLPAWGLSNAAATLVGQNLGAKRPERAERSVWLTGFLNMGFLGVVSIAYIVWNDELIRIFTRDPAVIAAGAECMRIVAYGYIVYAWGQVMPQAFNGAGDTMTPTKINFFCYWLLEIPLAWTLALWLGLGQRGVWWAIVVAEAAMGASSIYLFSRGRWKNVRV
jgi:putative MATE family efflux protein